MGANWLWLFNAIKNIDYNFSDLMKESFLVCRESQGGITYQDLNMMDFDRYLDVVKYANFLQTPKENIDG